MQEVRSSKLEQLVMNLINLSPFVFPLYLLRFNVAGIPFTFLEAYTYVLFAVFFFAVAGGKIRLSWAKPARWYYYFAFILFLGATLGVIIAPHYIALPSGELLDAQITALGVWKGWILAPMLYFFAFTQTLRSSNELKRLLVNFVYASGLVVLVSYGFAMFGNGFTYDLRLSGFFESANYLSLYIAPALLLSVYFLLSSGLLQKREKLLNLIVLTALTHALFLTQSYAAIIGVFGSLSLYILMILIKQRIKTGKVFIAFFLLIVTFAVIIGTQFESRKFQQFLDLENRSSSSVRLEIYEVAWGLAESYPLTGVGPGLFQAYYQTKGPDILGKAPMEWNIPHPHNIFLAFWLNAGLLGLLAILGFLILVHTRLTYPLLAFWGIIIHGLFDTPFWKNDLAMIFWLILGAILIIQTYGTNSSKKRKNPIRKRTGIRHSSSARTERI